MPQRPPATPGIALADVDTPALIVDLDAFERNLRRMADAVAKAGVKLRPHAKTHKSPVIGLKQMALGAVGVGSLFAVAGAAAGAAVGALTRAPAKPQAEAHKA